MTTKNRIDKKHHRCATSYVTEDEMNELKKNDALADKWHFGSCELHGNWNENGWIIRYPNKGNLVTTLWGPPSIDLCPDCAYIYRYIPKKTYNSLVKTERELITREEKDNTITSQIIAEKILEELKKENVRLTIKLAEINQELKELQQQ